MTLEFQHRVVTVGQTRDGDTYGFHCRILPDTIQSIVGRLLGFDCPESRRLLCRECGLRTSDYELAKAAETYNVAVAFLNGPGDLWCRREMKRDSFGRELVTVWHVIDGIETDLGTSLLDAGLATPWPTRWHEVFDPLRNRTY